MTPTKLLLAVPLALLLAGCMGGDDESTQGQDLGNGNAGDGSAGDGAAGNQTDEEGILSGEASPEPSEHIPGEPNATT